MQMSKNSFINYNEFEDNDIPNVLQNNDNDENDDLPIEFDDLEFIDLE